MGLFIGAYGTDLSVGVRLLSGETLLQAKNSTGRRWDSNPGPVGYKSSVLTTKPRLLPTNGVFYKQIKELESRSEAAPRARPKTAAADAKAQKQVAILTDQLQDKKKDIKELQAKIAQLQEDVKAAKSDGAADVS